MGNSVNFQFHWFDSDVKIILLNSVILNFLFSLFFDHINRDLSVINLTDVNLIFSLNRCPAVLMFLWNYIDPKNLLKKIRKIKIKVRSKLIIKEWLKESLKNSYKNNNVNTNKKNENRNQTVIEFYKIDTVKLYYLGV